MKLIQTIKDWFKPKYIGQQVSSNYLEDAAVLKRLATEAPFLQASNKKRYWYYFPGNPKDAPVVLWLLQQNGVWAAEHMSRYGRYRGEAPRLAFRICTSYFLANPAVEKFVKLISKDDEQIFTDDFIDGKVAALRKLFAEKQK